MRDGSVLVHAMFVHTQNSHPLLQPPPLVSPSSLSMLSLNWMVVSTPYVAVCPVDTRDIGSVWMRRACPPRAAFRARNRSVGLRRSHELRGCETWNMERGITRHHASGIISASHITSTSHRTSHHTSTSRTHHITSHHASRISSHNIHPVAC